MENKRQIRITEDDYTPPGSFKHFRRVQIVVDDANHTECHTFFGLRRQDAQGNLEPYVIIRAGEFGGTSGTPIDRHCRPVRVEKMPAACLAWLGY